MKTVSSPSLLLALFLATFGVAVHGCSSTAPLFECLECMCEIGVWQEMLPETIPDVILAGNPLVETPDGPLLVGEFSFAGGPPMSLWGWDGTNWIDETIDAPDPAPNKAALAAAYHAQADHLLVAGGEGGGAALHTWTLSSGVWTRQAQDVPARRINARAAYDASEGNVIVFGGGTLADLAPSDTWAWDGSNWSTPISAQEPPQRFLHALAYDAPRESIVMFGGEDESGKLGDTWLYRGTEWTEALPTMSPAPRSAHTLTYYPDFEVTVLYGGDLGPFGASDVWTWDGTDWKRVHIPGPGPGPREMHVAAYDAVSQAIVMFRDDTWLFRLTEVEASTGQCCGDGVCQFPERDPRNPTLACPTDCPN